MRLIDADALKKDWSMANRCEECPQNARKCQYEQNFTRMDICEMLDEAPTVSGWISVKDRLPDDASDVLAYYYSECESRIAPVNYYKGVWYDCVFNRPLDTLGQQKITHWMPLPEPPKDGEV